MIGNLELEIDEFNRAGRGEKQQHENNIQIEDVSIAPPERRYSF
jgi:hypothetical protein